MHGKGTDNSAWKSQTPAFDEPVDQLVDHRPHAVLAREDLARREVRIQDAPVLHMIGRVDLQRDERTLLADVDRHEIRAEDLGMLQCELHVVVPADDVGAGNVDEPGDGGLVPQEPVEGQRIRRHAAVVRVGRPSRDVHERAGIRHLTSSSHEAT